MKTGWKVKPGYKRDENAAKLVEAYFNSLPKGERVEIERRATAKVVEAMICGDSEFSTDIEDLPNRKRNGKEK